jgi:hypothetical protein
MHAVHNGVPVTRKVFSNFAELVKSDYRGKRSPGFHLPDAQCFFVLALP